MHTVLELLQKTTDYFGQKRIESARYNAEMLLAKVLRCRRLDLYLMFDKPMDESNVNEYRELVKQRAAFVPLQYLLGQIEFYNVTLNIRSGALIPRPETEILVESVIEVCKDLSNPAILDIGTGSGNIAIATAFNLEHSHVLTIDINPKALALANENILLNKLEQRVKALQCDVFGPEIMNLGKFDVLVSNPPYVSLEDYQALQEEIVKYEPRNAVTDEGDGFRFYRRLIEVAPKLLKQGGWLMVELALGQAECMREMMTDAGFIEIGIVKDLQSIDRIVKGKWDAGCSSAS
ncbi:MAG: peptide chain release factor N(5)-glutamine methyltransferase [Ignavibacteria bacterium]|nr:peptide chain release factor N(5)-glutamine methyltransferase [Ignavibacteria bacterium]